jgi:DNA-binding MarR family transcriptional regulator
MEPKQNPTLDPDLPLGHWLKRAYLAMTAHVNEVLRPHDLTHSQWQVLALVGKCDPAAVTQKKIQCCLRVEAATLTGVVDGLVRRGWLIRRENAEDRRVNELCLTDAGKAVHSELSSWVTAKVAERVQQGLTPAQVAETKAILQQIAANLEAG